MNLETLLSSENVLFAGVFLGVLIMFVGLQQLFSPHETGSEARNRRMKLVNKGVSTEDRLKLLKPSNDGGAIGSLPLLRGLPLLLRQSGAVASAGTFLTWCGIIAATLAGVASAVMPLPIAAAFGVLIGLGLPVLVLISRRNTRMALMVKQLPDALDLMARSLKVGHPLNTSIAAVATDLRDPIATEFGIMIDQIAYGDTLVDAFSDFADRIDQEDIRYMSVAVSVQHGTGGDLAEVLKTMAGVIRDRLSMRKRILAISAEGRLTAWFLSFLPIFIFVVSSITSPGYYGDVADSPLFQPFAMVVVTLMVVNFIAMRKVVNFRF